MNTARRVELPSSDAQAGRGPPTPRALRAQESVQSTITGEVGITHPTMKGKDKELYH